MAGGSTAGEALGSSPMAGVSEDALPSEECLEARARELFELWGEELIETLAHVEVIWNRRLRTTAGRALPRKLRIELNPKLLARVPARIDEVLTHEAAHLATYLVHGAAIREHGAEWRALMEVAGQPTRVTHDFPIQGLGASYYLHVCGGCGQRTISKSARSRRACGCSADAIEVYRAPRNAAGRRSLAAFVADPGGASDAG